MLPYLHKFISASPSAQPTKAPQKSHRRSSRKHASTKQTDTEHKSNSQQLHAANSNAVDSQQPQTQHNGQSHANSILAMNIANTMTISSDTVHSQSRKSFKSENSSTSKSKSSNIAQIFASNGHPTVSQLDTIQDDDLDHKHMHNELSSTSESKVIFIETKPEKTSSSSSKKKADKKYWTVSIASKHNSAVNEYKAKSKERKLMTMGFGICEMLNYDDSLMSGLNTNQLLNSSNYGYGYCVTYSDNHKYQSYHTTLKSLDDILISFNTKSNKLTLWQNGKRFNRVFQLQQAKIYGFGIKLYGNDYCIKIMPNTGN